MYVGFNMVYFLAALQNVDRSIEEAALVDGAGPWQRFRHVSRVQLCNKSIECITIKRGGIRQARPAPPRW